jgi:hypothetical protein
MNFTPTTDYNALTNTQTTDLRTMEPTKCDFSDPNNPVWVRPFDEEKTELRKKFIEMNSIMKTSNDTKKQYSKEINELQDNYNKLIIGTEQYILLHNGVEIKSRVNKKIYKYNIQKNSNLIIDCFSKAMDLFLSTIEDFKLIETYKLYDRDWINQKKEYLYDCIKILFSTYHKIRKNVLYTYQELQELLHEMPRRHSIVKTEVKYKEQYIAKIMDRYNFILYKMNNFSNKVAIFETGIICPIFKCWTNNMMGNHGTREKEYAHRTVGVSPGELKANINERTYCPKFDKENWKDENGKIDSFLSGCQINNYKMLRKDVKKRQGGNPEPFIQKLEQGTDEWVLEGSKILDENNHIIKEKNIINGKVKYIHAVKKGNKVYIKNITDKIVKKEIKY